MSKPESISPPADTMRERAGNSRAKMLFLVSANRWYIAGILAAIPFVVVVAAGAFLFDSPQDTLTTDTVRPLFQTIFLAIVTSVVLALTIGQLILAEEMGALGEQRERMEDEIAFRKDVEESSDIGVSPSTPAAFLQTLIAGVNHDASDLGEIIDDESNREAATQITEFVTVVTEHGEKITDDLANAQFGSFNVISAVLDYNYSWKIYAVRRLRHEHEADLEDDDHEAFEELIDVLTLFGPALEHFKSLYFQWELVNLTRAILYTAIPALVVSIATVLYLSPNVLPGAALGVDSMVWLVSASATFALVPFFVLASYVVRIATISKRTGSLGPFILRDSERTTAIDWAE
ncbi:MAG: hypothetical protein IH933_05465 [Euryarchaeota archaeon]|nr:hypothetical protein [Euryarchaeota archaeon]